MTSLKHPTTTTQPTTGDRVVTSAGTSIGAVDDVLVDLERGIVSHVMVRFEHVLGLEDHRFAVRPEAFTFAMRGENTILTLDIDPGSLVCPDTATLLLV